MTYYSQAGQDEWVHKLIGDKGVFVEVGAYDGIQTSNTYALEQLGWNGICIEANPAFFASCKVNRRLAVHSVVTNYKGMIGFGIDRIGGETYVPCDYLHGILKDNACPRDIDYLSMDIEGHELTVLEAFPLDHWNIKLITIEHNLYCDGPVKKEALYQLLTRNGYVRVREDVPCLDTNPAYYMQPYEDWYAHQSFKI